MALLDGAPNKKNYKAYHVKTVSDGDDYGAMFEVLSRRFKRGRDAKAEEPEIIDQEASPEAEPGTPEPTPDPESQGEP